MSIIANLKKLFFYRQHPETALRYIPIVNLLKKNKLDDLSIIEIGSGSYGITPYLKKTITGVDTSFDEPEYPFLKQIKTSGDKLPFKDNEFDVALLSDVLEHIPKKNRKKTLEEAVRVSKKVVIISGPMGEELARQDQKLAKYSEQKLGLMHHSFKDHLEFGLPDVEDIKNDLKSHPKIKAVKIIGKYLNLKKREWLMKYFITNSKLGFYFYLKGLMTTVPFLLTQNEPPCYRTLILVSLRDD